MDGTYVKLKNPIIERDSQTNIQKILIALHFIVI